MKMLRLLVLMSVLICCYSVPVLNSAVKIPYQTIGISSNRQQTVNLLEQKHAVFSKKAEILEPYQERKYFTEFKKNNQQLQNTDNVFDKDPIVYSRQRRDALPVAYENFGYDFHQHRHFPKGGFYKPISHGPPPFFTPNGPPQYFGDWEQHIHQGHGCTWPGHGWGHHHNKFPEANDWLNVDNTFDKNDMVIPTTDSSIAITTPPTTTSTSTSTTTTTTTSTEIPQIDIRFGKD